MQMSILYKKFIALPVNYLKILIENKKNDIVYCVLCLKIQYTLIYQNITIPQYKCLSKSERGFLNNITKLWLTVNGKIKSNIIIVFTQNLIMKFVLGIFYCIKIP